VGDRSLVELAQDTAWYGADALVVTGSATGAEASIEDVKACKAATGLPTVLGSGVTTGNVAQMLGAADSAIVGTSLKAGQVTTNPVDAVTAAELMDAVRVLR
jgi:predicted TIM-barrel enzyme